MKKARIAPGLFNSFVEASGRFLGQHAFDALKGVSVPVVEYRQRM
jgi:hypothetical protein